MLTDKQKTSPWRWKHNLHGGGWVFPWWSQGFHSAFTCWQTLRNGICPSAEPLCFVPLKEHAPPVGKECNSTSADLQLTCQSVQLCSKNGNSCRRWVTLLSSLLISAAHSLVIRLVAPVDCRCNTNSHPTSVSAGPHDCWCWSLYWWVV